MTENLDKISRKFHSPSKAKECHILKMDPLTPHPNSIATLFLPIHRFIHSSSSSLCIYAY